MRNQPVYDKIEKHLKKLEAAVEVEVAMIREFIKNLKVYNHASHSRKWNKKKK